jgi:hypothetical protein
MPSYRITVRYGGQPPRYEVLDLEAPDLGGALTAAAQRLSPAVVAAADLAEIRAQAVPEERDYVEPEAF